MSYLKLFNFVFLFYHIFFKKKEIVAFRVVRFRGVRYTTRYPENPPSMETKHAMPGSVSFTLEVEFEVTT